MIAAWFRNWALLVAVGNYHIHINCDCFYCSYDGEYGLPMQWVPQGLDGWQK